VREREVRNRRRPTPGGPHSACATSLVPAATSLARHTPQMSQTVRLSVSARRNRSRMACVERRIAMHVEAETAQLLFDLASTVDGTLHCWLLLDELVLLSTEAPEPQEPAIAAGASPTHRRDLAGKRVLGKQQRKRVIQSYLEPRTHNAPVPPFPPLPLLGTPRMHRAQNRTSMTEYSCEFRTIIPR
jgi:hypothetical protein